MVFFPTPPRSSPLPLSEFTLFVSHWKTDRHIKNKIKYNKTKTNQPPTRIGQNKQIEGKEPDTSALSGTFPPVRHTLYLHCW